MKPEPELFDTSEAFNLYGDTVKDAGEGYEQEVNRRQAKAVEKKQQLTIGINEQNNRED